MTKVIFSRKLTGAAGAVLAPGTSPPSPLLRFPAGCWCWPWLLGPGNQWPSVLWQQWLCESKGPAVPLAVAAEEHLLCPAPVQPAERCLLHQERDPSGSAARGWETLTPCRNHSACFIFLLAFLLRMRTKKTQGSQSNFWVVDELLAPSLPALSHPLLQREQIELRIPGEENSLMIPP